VFGVDSLNLCLSKISLFHCAALAYIHHLFKSRIQKHKKLVGVPYSSSQLQVCKTHPHNHTWCLCIQI